MARRPQQPPLVVHIIHELGTGGLENGLVNIINRSPPGRYRHAIVCLTRAGEFATRISAPDVQVIELHKRPGHDFGLYWRLLRALRMLRPAIVHTRNLSTLEMQFVAAVLPGVKHVHGEHGRDVFDLHGTNRKYNLLRKAARRRGAAVYRGQQGPGTVADRHGRRTAGQGSPDLQRCGPGQVPSAQRRQARYGAVGLPGG